MQNSKKELAKELLTANEREMAKLELWEGFWNKQVLSGKHVQRAQQELVKLQQDKAITKEVIDYLGTQA